MRSYGYKELTQAMHQFVAAKGWYDPEAACARRRRAILPLRWCWKHRKCWSTSNGLRISRDPEELPGELADVTLYLLQLASILDIDLEQAVMDKLKKLRPHLGCGSEAG
jgi:hypothetical protein